MNEQAGHPPNVLTASTGCAEDLLGRVAGVLAFLEGAIPAAGNQDADLIPGAHDGIGYILGTVRDAVEYLEEQRLPWIKGPGVGKKLV